MAFNRIWAAGAAASMLTTGVLGGMAMHTWAEQSAPAAPTSSPPAPAGKPAGASATPPAGGGMGAAGVGGGVTPAMLQELVKGLQATPGCLSVEMGTFMSRKNVIFAFFKDEASVMTWYKSKEHQAAVDAVAPQRDKNKVPMAGIAEDAGPIMVVASIAAGGEGAPKLGIELYSPLKAGLRLPGGGFAPEGFGELVKKK